MKIANKLVLLGVGVSACLTSVNATPLEETFKNVDISGTMAAGYNGYKNGMGPGKNLSFNYFKTAVNIKNKFSDEVTVNLRTIIGDKTNIKLFHTESGSDENLDVTLSELNFEYTGIKDFSFKVGKQAIDTPFTMARDVIGNEHVGTGLISSTKIGELSLTGGYFNVTNFQDGTDTKMTFTGSEDVVTLGAKYNMSVAKFDISYIDVSSKFNAYSLGTNVNFKLSSISFNTFARYSSLDKDEDNKDNTLWQTGVEARKGIYGAFLAYGKTNKEGGETALDGSSVAGMDPHWRVTLTGQKDASVVYAAIDAQVHPKINVALKYSGMKRGGQTDLKEHYIQIAYFMNKNFFTYVRLGKYDQEISKDTSARWHMQYSF